MRISRTALLATTLLSGVAFATPAFAEGAQTPPVCPPGTAVGTNGCVAPEAAPAPAPAPAGGEAIVVTGSRIASPNITSLAPVQVVGEQEINQSGAVNIQEVLNQNPAFGQPGFSTTNTAFLTTGAGIATVNLRNLGETRTLVLINNRRVVGGFAGTPIVDLNNIPTQFLERVDVLTGGQSALYGSDAVAGVVNFIYKRNFEGLLLEGQYGLTEKGDDQRYQLSATAGGNFMDGRGNIMVHVGYSNDKGLLSRERAADRIDNASKFAYSTSDPADFETSLLPFFSGIPPQGVFNAGPYRFTFNPAGDLQPCFVQNGTSCDSQKKDKNGNIIVPRLTTVNGGFGTGPNGFNRNFFRTLSTPVSRYLFAERSRFDITDNISFITEATYARTHAFSQIEPFGLTSGNINPATGDVPIQVVAGGACNPFVPQAICDAATTDTTGPFTGLKTISFNRRLTDINVRSSDVNRNFFRLVASLEGKLLNDRFQWDIGYNFGSTNEQQHTTGQVNTQNFLEALQVVPNGAGGFQCADPVAVANGCVPIDIFGNNSISPAAAAWVNADSQHNATIRQQVWDANISGSLVDLPAGPLGVALGAEYRKESSNEDFDALTNAGLNGGNLLPDVKGSFTVKEAYAEVNVPILKDLPFAYQLSVRAAGRISDYSTIGSAKTWEIGGDYAPIPDIRFRGTLARAVRAPNISELFSAQAQTFPTGLTDPCEGIKATDTVGPKGGLASVCLAAGQPFSAGVATNIGLNGALTLSQLDKQGISGFNGGNPNLKAEVANTRTFGVVIAPRSIPALRNLSLSVDYWHIKVDDAIQSIPRQTILNTCFKEGLASTCALITRFPVAQGASSAGAIEFINAFQINIASLTRAGIDAVLQYRTGLGTFMGSPLNMNARIAYTHLLKGFDIPLAGEPKNRRAGEIDNPNDKFDATLGFDNRLWGISFHGTYIGKAFEDDQFLAGFTESDGVTPLGPNTISIKPIFYLDSQIKFTPVKNYEFYVGVDNLLNTQPPIILQGNAFNTTGSNTDESVYDVFGRRYYAGVRLRF